MRRHALIVRTVDLVKSAEIEGLAEEQAINDH
jgi:hypothetical protein